MYLLIVLRILVKSNYACFFGYLKPNFGGDIFGDRDNMHENIFHDGPLGELSKNQKGELQRFEAVKKFLPCKMLQKYDSQFSA